MKSFQQLPYRFQGKPDSVDPSAQMDFLQPQLIPVPKDIAKVKTGSRRASLKKKLFRLHYSIKLIGVSRAMDDYEKRKLGIFNQINFFQLLTGITIPLIGLLHNKKFPEWAWLVASLPALISMVVLWMNELKRYEAAIIFYFIFYPVATSIVYMSGINMGVELFFILYGILSVFFIQQISYMIFSVSLSMISYFMLSVVWKYHRFELESSNMLLYLSNQILGIIFIFYGLFLIKKENASYQSRVLAKNREIAEKAALLKKQTTELSDLNSVKNKLFSVIAHDLKTPMYALRNLFRSVLQQNLPAKEIKSMLPDVIDDLNYTTGLMENLLHWAKSQMQSEVIKAHLIDMHAIVQEVIQLLQLQADAKSITIESKIEESVFALADKDMINLVIRNLLSNAIKFTPGGGQIAIDANEMPSYIEVYIKDSGTGISQEALQKINQNNYFTTNGTAQEPGTGLGLMLCKEFLIKNGGQLCIESEPGAGSIFSFTLPRPE